MIFVVIIWILTRKVLALLALFADKWIIPAGLLGALLYAIGGPWDQLIHVHQGHTLLATPHLIIGAGLSLYIFSGIVLTPLILRRGCLSSGERNSLRLVALGAIILPFGFAFDESWHRIFGVDMTAWSPPHVAIFLSMAAVLLGFALLEANRARQRAYSGLSWADARLMFFFASIFFVALFFFIDFDVPGMAQWITSTRPAFSYPIATTGVIVFLALFAITVTQKPGFATVAALIAWGYYTGMGVALGVIDFAGEDLHRILPPFPIVAPILAADALFFLTKKLGISLSMHPLWPAAFFTALLCYVSIIVWVELYAQLPHQGFGADTLWFRWFPFVFLIAICAEAAAFFLARWALRGDARRSSA